MIRDLMIWAGIGISQLWKHQDKSQPGILYGMVRTTSTTAETTNTPPCQIRKRVPELEPFVNNWGAEYLVQETFNHRHSHRLFTHRQRDRAEQEAETDEEAKAQAKAESKAARAARRKGVTPLHYFYYY
jgi:hypothetical protein